MTRVLVLLILLSSPVVLASQSAPPTSSGTEPRALAERVMRYLPSDDIKGLFAFAHTLMPADKSEMDKFRDTTISQRKALDATIGPYVGFAFIGECRKSEQVSRVTFIEKRTKNYLRWEFIFYKPKDKWQLSAFYWDNKNAEIFAAC